MENKDFMDKYFKMLAKPMQSILSDGFYVFLLAFPAHIFLDLYAAANELVIIEWKLVLAVTALVFIDFVTGVMASRKRKEKITSLKARQTGIKIIEYFMVLFSITLISNMADQINFIQQFAFIFLAMIELKSIVENLSEDNGIIKQLFEAIRKTLSDRGQILKP